MTSSALDSSYMLPHTLLAVLYACDDCITRIEVIDAFTEFIDV